MLLPGLACPGATHPGAIRRPVALEQVLLEVVLVAGEHLCAAVGRRKRPHVPHAKRVVLRAEERMTECMTVLRNRHASHKRMVEASLGDLARPVTRQAKAAAQVLQPLMWVHA